MKFRIALLVLAASSCIWPQTPQLPIDTPPKKPISGDTVIATVNGQKLTAREFEALLTALDPQMRDLAQKQPQTFLEQWALMQVIVAEAEKGKLDQQSPYKEKLEQTRRQILMQAQVEEKGKSVKVTPEEQKRFFEANHDRYFQAKVKVIFVSRMSQTQTLQDKKVVGTTTPEQAKAKAESVLKRARAGEDFAKLALETSDDPSTAEKGADFPDPIRPSSANIPQNIRDAILTAKAGNIVGPIEHDTGYYIFRVESIGLPPYETLKDEVLTEIRNTALRQWIEQARSRATVKIESQSFFANPRGTM